MSEQRKSDWQHPNSYYRKREETEHAATDECDTSRHPQPFRTIPTKAVQVMADPGRDVILEALHFLVEIGNPRHPRSSDMRFNSVQWPSRPQRPSLDRSLRRRVRHLTNMAGFNRNSSAKSRAPGQR